jgi:hypothetical protein
MQLWLAFDDGDEPFIFLVTEVADYPMGKVLRLCLLAGRDVRRILPLMWKLEGWAKIQGAFCVEVSTRPKLARLLSRYGYCRPLTTIFKPLFTVN